jgi:hypothetical protein
MRRPWYVADRNLYQSVRRTVEAAYPDLVFIEQGIDVLIRGYYPLAEGGRVYDRYQIEITPDECDERGIPKICEIGGRIPRDIARHIEKDGTACITLPDSFWHEHPGGMSLVEYLDGPVRGYFAAQSLIDLGEPSPWPVGEWAHGANGIVDFYRDKVGTDNGFTILRFLKLLTKKEVKGHVPCPCNNGKKLRACHGTVVRELRARIPRRAFSSSERRMADWLQEAYRRYQQQTVFDSITIP